MRKFLYLLIVLILYFQFVMVLKKMFLADDYYNLIINTIDVEGANDGA